MNEQRMSSMGVLGAGGKMGRGIACLLLEMLSKRDAPFKLYLVDADPDALISIKKYLRDNLQRLAEKNMVSLREMFTSRADLVSNEEMIQAFVEMSLDQCFFSTKAEQLRACSVIFEAIVENFESKAEALSLYSDTDIYILSNTSSIPIGRLAKKSKNERRMIGYHFYNPPPVQKLLELIVPQNVDPKLVAFSKDLADRLGKTVVESADAAGFIGNGHLIREVLFALRKTKALTMPSDEAVSTLNAATEKLLLRPMGIFQLLDYVGIDVFVKITEIMNEEYPNEDFSYPFIKELLLAERAGGQYPDGTQKMGFFTYDGRLIKSVWSFEKEKEMPYQPDLGELPTHYLPWKQVVKSKDFPFDAYFLELRALDTKAARLASDFLSYSSSIAKKLVEQGVAKNQKDVDRVLQKGFYHPYGLEGVS